MKVQGKHTAVAPSAEIWRALEDPAVLSQTLPGLQRLEVIEPDRYSVTLEVGVGSIKGTYDGTFAIADKSEPESCTVRASAKGSQGSVEAVARMQLTAADGGGTLITYEADTTLTGPVAGVGQRMIGAAAKRTTKEFFTAIDSYLATDSSTRASAPSETSGADPVASQAPSPVDAPGPVVPGAVYTRSATPSRDLETKSLLLGFAMALAGVVIGHWMLG